jgi:hypothetical protein
LGQGPKQVEDELASGTGGIDILGETLKAHAAGFEDFDDRDQRGRLRPNRSSRHTTSVSAVRR